MKGLRLLKEKLESNLLPKGECLEWQGATNNKGYGMIRTEEKVETVHRVAFKLYNGEIPEGMKVRHTCDNRLCAAREHLILGTSQDNSNDMLERARQAVGERQGNATLKEEQVRQIVAKYETGNYTQAQLGAEYNVLPGTISKIVRKERWGYLWS